VSKETTYKIFTIRSAPLQLRDSSLWTPSIAIEWERDGQTTVRPFSAQSHYATESEADIHGLIYGMRIIDGQVPGASVR